MKDTVTGSPEASGEGLISREPQKEKELRKVVLVLHGARQLERRGVFAKTDPYAVVTCAGNTFKSPLAENSTTPEWNFRWIFKLKSIQNRFFKNILLFFIFCLFKCLYLCLIDTFLFLIKNYD